MTKAGPGSARLDVARLRTGRLERVRAQLRQRELAASVLVDPVNIRYPSGARDVQVFHARNPARSWPIPEASL